MNKLRLTLVKREDRFCQDSVWYDCIEATIKFAAVLVPPVMQVLYYRYRGTCTPASRNHTTGTSLADTTPSIPGTRYLISVHVTYNSFQDNEGVSWIPAGIRFSITDTPTPYYWYRYQVPGTSTGELVNVTCTGSIYVAVPWNNSVNDGSVVHGTRYLLVPNITIGPVAVSSLPVVRIQWHRVSHTCENAWAEFWTKAKLNQEAKAGLMQDSSRSWCWVKHCPYLLVIFLGTRRIRSDAKKPKWHQWHISFIQQESSHSTTNNAGTKSADQYVQNQHAYGSYELLSIMT